jgi:threonine synthase
MSVSVVLRCAGCATTVDPLDVGAPSPFRCPNVDRAKNVDHVLAWDPVVAGVSMWPNEVSTNPFLRYRTLHHSYHLHLGAGGTDAEYVRIVERLDEALVKHGGPGFTAAPLAPMGVFESTTGFDTWFRDDTNGVAGSHKARHLMAILLHLEVRKVPLRVPLAIASCGNAAIAAATLARAAGRTVQVFVPSWTKAVSLDKLKALGARVVVCPRLDDDPPGDPCMHRFREALAKGALPFCVQGPENGFTIDGGATSGQELVDGFAMLGVPDRLFIQVGAGAWASGVWRGLRDGLGLGVIDRLPALHCVQAEGCAPLVTAWRVVVDRALSALDHGSLIDEGFDVAAAALVDPAARSAVDAAMQWALTHRSSVMTVWENPHSVATGILDDEAYDWAALVRAMIVSGGWPVTVSDTDIENATSLVNGADLESFGINADETGASAAAGVLAFAEEYGTRAERVVATVTGVRRE